MEPRQAAAGEHLARRARRAWTRASPGAGARDVCAQNGCGRPRDRRTEHTFAGRERSMAPSAWASAGGAARVGRWDEGPCGVCRVGLLIARPVAPRGDGRICPHEASCTMSAEVLCHNPPGPARGAWTSGSGQTSEPARSRGAFPCARASGLCSLEQAHGRARDQPLLSCG